MVTYLGSLVQLRCGEGGTLQTNVPGECGECAHYLGHTGFAPAHGRCAFPVYTAQAPGCSAGDLSKAGPGLCVLQVLVYSTKAQTRLGLCFVPFPGPGSSGDQVIGKRTVPGGLCMLITSPVPAT